jgi:hypothetical protein
MSCDPNRDHTHYAGCECHEQGWENKWKAAVDMAARASIERDAIAHDLDTLRADINALLTETDQQQELHAADRHIEFTRRKIDFFHKHQELLRPRHSHEEPPGRPATPQDGTQDPTP